MFGIGDFSYDGKVPFEASQDLRSRRDIAHRFDVQATHVNADGDQKAMVKCTDQTDTGSQRRMLLEDPVSECQRKYGRDDVLFIGVDQVSLAMRFESFNDLASESGIWFCL